MGSYIQRAEVLQARIIVSRALYTLPHTYTNTFFIYNTRLYPHSFDFDIRPDSDFPAPSFLFIHSQIFLLPPYPLIHLNIHRVPQLTPRFPAGAK